MIVEEKKLKYEGVKGIAHNREPGNAVRHHTGSWRVKKPVIDLKKCIKCKICFTFCPDSAIKWVDGKPKIDYYMCKGCGVCVEECPVKCIEMIKEGEK